MLSRSINISVFIILSICLINASSKKFPKKFIFGVASSSYQAEGAWNENEKGVSIWDHFTHTRPENIQDGSNADVACDSYHKFEDDVALLKKLGVNYYRFSLSWTRILPSGYANNVNEAGIRFYDKIINTLLENGITPMVTIYHWDLPQALQDLGGFTNVMIIRRYAEYARVVFSAFGDRVKIWTTFNEPKQICKFGYGTGRYAPGFRYDGVADYMCTHNLIKAHAKVYHIYKNVYRRKQNGRVGIVIDCSWNEPASQLKEDVEAAERQTQFDCGFYAHPIFSKSGDYPEVVKEFVTNRSMLENFPKSRLPVFTKTQINYIRGTYDYFGLNHYNTYIVANREENLIGRPSQDNDAKTQVVHKTIKCAINDVGAFKSAAAGFRKILNWLKNNYNNPTIIITENGYPDKKTLNDKGRVNFFLTFLNSLLETIYKDGVKVKAYTAWSFLDYFEWDKGYTVGYGLHYVNYSDPERPRIPKDSALAYSNIIKTRKVSNIYET